MRKVRELQDENTQKHIMYPRVFQIPFDHLVMTNVQFYDHVFIPPQVKERDRGKKGMKNRRDADREWNTWAVEKAKCTEHSTAREWLNDPILGSLLDTRQRCMKIDTQVLDSVCWIIKRIDIILQPRMKTK